MTLPVAYCRYGVDSPGTADSKQLKLTVCGSGGHTHLLPPAFCTTTPSMTKLGSNHMVTHSPITSLSSHCALTALSLLSYCALTALSLLSH